MHDVLWIQSHEVNVSIYDYIYFPIMKILINNPSVWEGMDCVYYL